MKSYLIDWCSFREEDITGVDGVTLALSTAQLLGRHRE